MQGAIKENVGLRMGVEVVEPQTLPRSELQFKRIVDMWPKEVHRKLER